VSVSFFFIFLFFFPVFFFQYYCFIFLSLCLFVLFFCSFFLFHFFVLSGFFWFYFFPLVFLLGCDPHFPSAPLPFVSILVLPVGAVGPRCL
jgi:hypothetical protein